MGRSGGNIIRVSAPTNRGVLFLHWHESFACLSGGPSHNPVGYEAWNARFRCIGQGHGFSNSPGGTHTSRTIMLEELQLLLAACPVTATLEVYLRAIVDDNVLRKYTLTTRKRTLKSLRELYRLDPRVLLFRALRDLWHADSAAQPLLALLCAFGRDRLVRASASLILDTPRGDEMMPEMLSRAVGSALPL